MHVCEGTKSLKDREER